MKARLLICLALTIAWIATNAQSYKWKGDLEKVNTTGFYKIALGPDFISKTETSNLADIRIFERNTEIAYLIRQFPDSIYLKDTIASKLLHYTAIPAPSIVIKEDKANQRSVIQLIFKSPYQLDKLTLKAEGFKYYRRTAWLTDVNPLIKPKKNRYSENRLVNFIISSEKQPVIDIFGPEKYKQLFLVIENEDNSPLLIKNITAYQKNTELITYLEKDKQYVIKTGQPDVYPPRYDLSYFKDSISHSLPFINILHFEMNKNKAEDKAPDLIKKNWMWAAIGLLILFLGSISYIMVRDMQRKKQEH